MRIELSEEDVNRICDLYRSGLGIKEIGKVVGVSGASVWLVLKRVGIERSGRGKRRYKLNVDSFSKGTDESDYWAGYIWGDGSILVAGGKYRLSVTIKGSDMVHLEKLNKFLCSDYPIKGYEGRGYGIGRVYWRLDINSKELIDVLEREYGLVSREVKHISLGFIRGLIDADGSIGIERVGVPFISLASKDLRLMERVMEWIRENVVENDYHLVKRDWGIYEVKFKHRKCVEIVKRLYGYGGVSLDRKQRIADDIINRWG